MTRKSNVGYSLPQLVIAPLTVTYAATVALNAGISSNFRITLTGDITLLAPTNPTDGQSIQVELTASGGARIPTLTVGSAGAFKYGSDITALTAVASGTTDVVGFKYNLAANRWWVIAYIKGL